MATHQGRQLLIVDTAMPHDVDPTASGVAGVYLLDLGAIREFVERGLESRRYEIHAVQTVVAQECERYATRASARLVAPLIARMHSNAEGIRADELARFDSRLADLTAEQHTAVEALTRQLVAKLLHGSTARLKEQAWNAHL